MISEAYGGVKWPMLRSDDVIMLLECFPVYRNGQLMIASLIIIRACAH